EPTSEDSTIAKFLSSRGEGIHHVAFETDSVVESLKIAESQGLRLIDKEPRPGAHGTKVAFLHPKSTCGVLIELVEESV
ncbi:MAG TPA: VOC family protein, partial [Bacillota bacterium]|nr:VOC family protein [Bacillota bacterium]